LAVSLTGNCTVAALVWGSAETAAKLAAFHAAPLVAPHDGFVAILASDTVDAVCIALPNALHAE
jgi:predicted dehydrogenase